MNTQAENSLKDATAAKYPSADSLVILNVETHLNSAERLKWLLTGARALLCGLQCHTTLCGLRIMDAHAAMALWSLNGFIETTMSEGLLKALRN